MEYQDSLFMCKLCEQRCIVLLITMYFRYNTDLFQMEKEKTHNLKVQLESELPKTELFFLLTISGTSFGDMVLDLDNYKDNQRKLEMITNKFVSFGMI